ncbi:hypothetical protein M1D88_09565 [Arthrobacter sp. R1-13]
MDTAQPLVSKLAVKDGKVLALGHDAELACGPQTRIVDLHGSFLMPGLLDVHNHQTGEPSNSPALPTRILC